MLAHMTAAKDLSPADMKDLLAAEQAYRAQGMPPKDAAMKALQELRDIMQGELDGHHATLQGMMQK